MTQEQENLQEDGNEEDIDNLTLQVKAALQDNNLPTFYFNGFSSTLSTGDILIILKRNDKQVAVLNTSYTVAKTLVHKLGGIIAQLEAKTGNTIMTTDDIGAKL